MSQPKRIIVTGASGFIGRNILAALIGSPFEVFAVSRRPTSMASFPANQWITADLLTANGRALVANVRADIFLHSAWHTEHGKFWTAKENLDWAEVSCELLHGFQKSGGRRFVGVGSCAEYSFSDSAVELHETRSRLEPTTLYGSSKNKTRRALETLCARHGVDFAWTRVFHLYGPGEHPDRLVPSVIRNLILGHEAACTNGEQQRDFMHVADVGAALAAVALSNVQGAVNIASGQPTTIRYVAERLGIILGRPELVMIGALRNRPDDPLFILADTHRLRLDVGFKPKFNLQTGLEDTVRWWRERESHR